MKKIIVLAFISLLAITTVKAQEESKAAVSGDGFTMADIFVSGTVSFRTNSQANTDSNQFTFSPRLGYFIDDNIAIGLDFGFTSRTVEETVFIPIIGNVINQTKDTSVGAGVFGRYYLTPESNFSLFGELGVSFVNLKQEQDQGEFKTNGVAFGFSPGINYFVSYNFAIEASVGLIGYDTFKADFDGAEPSNTFNIGVDLSDINLGVVYRF